MSFANNDPLWTATADFVEGLTGAGQSILAPDLFWRRFPKIHRYVNTLLEPAQEYDWLVLHKGDLAALGHAFLRRTRQGYRPVFANPVFVVLARDWVTPHCDGESDDVKALWINVDAVLAGPEAVYDPGSDTILPNAGVIETMNTLDEERFRESMNSFWRAGGYVYDTLRDQAYYREIDDYIADYVGDAAGLEVLDLCCGIGRLKNLLMGARSIAGIDVSDVAVDMAKARHDHPRFSFAVMDAHDLKFPDASFDLVLFVDAIEHVMRIDEVWDEAARVLKPGGRLFVTVASRDSLHEFMNRKLGYGEFETNYQHIREFGYRETLDMVAQRGLKVLREGGIFLYPYWGIPGVDQAVRHLTDDDAEVVETFRVLGRRAGPEYTYAFVLLLEKAA